MRIIQRYSKVVLLILIPAIVWLIFNSIYYRHLHLSSNGIVISHAHPFSHSEGNEASTPFSSHEHSELELVLYDVVSNLIIPTLVVLFISLVYYNYVKDKLNILFREKLIKQELFVLQEYRGPPIKF